VLAGKVAVEQALVGLGHVAGGDCRDERVPVGSANNIMLIDSLLWEATAAYDMADACQML
jgi:hypothetical protein